MQYRIKTIFDITQTGIAGRFRPDALPFRDKSGNLIKSEKDWLIARNKQRNLETLIQILMLRAQIAAVSEPTNEDDTWEFTFEIENACAYGDNLSLLIDDINSVPMISDQNQPGILEYGKNIWVSEIK